MNDPFFSKAVVYICEHGKEGAMGIIINKPMDNKKLNNILEKTSIINTNDYKLNNKIFFGGPVLLEKGIVLHGPKFKSNKSIPISKSIFITNEKKFLIKLKKKDTPFKLILGHSGWSKGQLEKELENGDWLVQNATYDFIFNIPPNQMWQYATELLGLDLLSSTGVIGKT
ncbi:MAG: YqgE/AlgH family protein [Candidatus Neomarinimicrobiota bacterium]